MATMMVTLGLAFVLDNANLLTFGPVAKPMPALIDGTSTIFGAVISNHRLAVFAIALVILGGLEVFLQTTRFGQAVRAVSQDLQGASQVGIDVNTIFSFTFGLAVALTGVAGFLLAPIFLVSPLGGWVLFLKAFVIVVFGGLGSTRGRGDCGLHAWTDRGLRRAPDRRVLDHADLAPDAACGADDQTAGPDGRVGEIGRKP